MSDEPPKKLSPFVCYYRGCGLRFDTSKGRNIHLKFKHYNASSTPPSKSTTKPKDQPTPKSCRIRGSVLDPTSPNYNHVTRYLQTSVIYKKIFSCAFPLCESFFISEEDLRQHMDKHWTSIKCPFDRCGSIVKLGDIPEHLLNVHKSNEGTCRRCGELIYYSIAENHAKDCQSRIKIMKVD